MVIDNLDHILEYMYARVPGRHPSFQISRDVFQDNHQIPLSEILMHLMDDGYIYQWVYYPEDHVPPPMREQYGLNVKGMEFFRKAKFGRRPYYSLEITSAGEEEIMRKQRDINLKNSTSEMWVKKHWLVLMIVSFIAGFLVDMARKL